VSVITQLKEIRNETKPDRADDLVRQTKISNIARLAKMLVDLFGLDEPYKKIGKYQGQEIEMYLKELDGYITFIIPTERANFNCFVKKAENPVAKVIIKVKEEKIIQVLSSIIRSKANLFGIIKLLKYLIPRKIVIKGSLIAALKLTRCLMIGKHDVYKKPMEVDLNAS
jgi:hypothetical protein